MIGYIFIKVMTSVSSKTKIDKSRAQFLYYNKYDIILVKFFIATLDLLLGFLYLLFFGNVIAAAKGEHFNFANYNLKAFLMLAILWILYIFAFAMSQ